MGKAGIVFPSQTQIDLCCMQHKERRKTMDEPLSLKTQRMNITKSLVCALFLYSLSSSEIYKYVVQFYLF